MTLYAYVLCLCILVSSRIPRYDLGRQTPTFLGGVLSHWGAAEMSWMQKWIPGKTLEVATPFIGLQREAVDRREGEGRRLGGVQCR
jgi:hypothetical protein